MARIHHLHRPGGGGVRARRDMGWADQRADALTKPALGPQRTCTLGEEFAPFAGPRCTCGGVGPTNQNTPTGSIVRRGCERSTSSEEAHPDGSGSRPVGHGCPAGAGPHRARAAPERPGLRHGQRAVAAPQRRQPAGHRPCPPQAGRGRTDRRRLRRGTCRAHRHRRQGPGGRAQPVVRRAHQHLRGCRLAAHQRGRGHQRDGDADVYAYLAASTARRPSPAASGRVPTSPAASPPAATCTPATRRAPTPARARKVPGPCSPLRTPVPR